MIKKIPNQRSNYIEENTLLEIKDIHSKDNQVSIIYKETRIKKCRLYESKMVGYVHLIPNIFLKKGLRYNDLLMMIDELNILNEVRMEQSGKIEAIYVEENQFVMYGTPLLLISYQDSN